MSKTDDDMSLDLLKQQKGIELPLGFPAGSCGKCGAPYYQDSFTGALRPLCCCWNLPKITTSNNTGGA